MKIVKSSLEGTHYETAHIWQNERYTNFLYNSFSHLIIIKKID